MNSLYEINNTLLNLFSAIEENEGEITEEQEKLLDITRDKLDEKLTDYKNAIQQWKNDIEAIKCESKRLSDRKNTLTNRIGILKENMLFAVENFGCKGKTNMYYELPDARIYTKANRSIELDEYKINIMLNAIVCYIKDYDNWNNTDFLKYLNSFAKSIGIEPYTQDDIDTMNINIIRQISLKDFINNKCAIHDEIKNEKKVVSNYVFININSKTDYSKFINIDNKKLTVAKEVITNSIQIK